MPEEDGQAGRNAGPGREGRLQARQPASQGGGLGRVTDRVGWGGWPGGVAGRVVSQSWSGMDPGPWSKLEEFSGVNIIM